MSTNAPTSITELIKLLPEGHASEDAAILKAAYSFAEQNHNGRQRPFGDTYLEHDLAVANSLLELGADFETVMGGLLHDILLPHTKVTIKTVSDLFGKTVGTMVSGVQTLDQYAANMDTQHVNDQELDPDNLEKIRQSILTIIEGEIRIILIRLADCLEDLRLADNLDKEERIRLAHEAMDIYAPLANRLGVWQIKWQVEDLAFRYLHPKVYQKIAKNLAEKRDERKKKIDVAVARLQHEIRNSGINAVVYGRPKHIYSIHRKMLQKDLEFEHIYDVQALRVVIEPDISQFEEKRAKEIENLERSLCYQVLGIVHGLWQPVPREFDDYIAAPKTNGYQSLHTAVLDPESGQSLEIQIRTQRMHEEAEKGIAAHWAYKETGSRVSNNVQRKIQNLRELLSSLRRADNGTSDQEILETELLTDRIYVFTPNGDVIELPKGASPIDFAYQIHTDIGHRCRGARVNGKMVSLDYQLQSGDRIEIITTNRPKPSRDWMNANLGYTRSARTRSKIRQWFRTQEKEQNILQGREVVERELRHLGLLEVTTVEDIAEVLKYKDVNQFLAKVGFGDISSSQISGAISRLHEKLEPDDELLPLLERPRPKPKGLTVDGISGLHTKMAKCCSPIPPEPIIGYITRGQGITIHSRNCKQVEAIREQERLIEVNWGQESETYPIPIIVESFRRPKLVDDILNILRGQKINVPTTKTVNQGNSVFIYLIAEVASIDQLNWLLKKLENLPYVLEVKRQRWT